MRKSIPYTPQDRVIEHALKTEPRAFILLLRMHADLFHYWKEAENFL